MHKRFTRLFPLITALLIGGAMQSVHADWDVNFGGLSGADPQDIVISLATDPNHDPEAACLAVTFARSLSGNPNANITLFVTLDGVNLASEDYITRKRLKEYECTTPPTMSGKISLVDHLTAYIDGNDNKMIVCPICWNERYEGENPDFGVLPGAEGVPGTAIGTTMFNADKILSF
ncbi:MAG: DsrE family protein [Gammaproteobacteria bacterium]|jgi:predicted peroxiredoxin